MKVLLTIVGIAIGLAAGYFLTLAIFGAGAGVGVATGLQAGACLTAEAAVAAGILTEDQIPGLLEGAVGLLTDAAGEEASEIDLSNADTRCAEIVEALQTAAEG